jgi:TolA-binding protein
MSLHNESEIMLAIGRLEGKVDTLIQMQRMQEDQIKNHEERLRQLEHSRSFTMGLAAAVGAVVSVALNLAVKALS